MRPSLSVVVPNYNHAKYLPQSLPAILGQSFQPIEVLVLDDASTDNSVEVIRRFAAENPLVRLIRNEKNLGVMPNLNKGVELSRGDYVFIGSADDEIIPGLFEKSMALLAQHQQAGLSCTVCEWRYVDTGLSWHMAVGMSDKPAYLAPDDLIGLGKRGKLLISSSSVVFRKNALQGVGMFHPELRWHADWFAMTTTAFRHGLCFVPEMLSIINILPKSYYTAGRKKDEHRQVLTNILNKLSTRDYSDVRPLIRDSGALSLFGPPMFRLLVGHKEFRPMLSSAFVRGTLRRTAELTGKKVLPMGLKKWILNTFYRHAAPA